MIVRIVSIVPVVSKNFWDDWDDRDDWGDRWFPYDRLDRPKEWELTVVSKIPGPDNRTLARDSQTKWRMLIEERISSRAILGLHCHAIKQNEKIIRKPFGRKSQEIV